MRDYAFDELSEEDRTLVLDLLTCVVDHEDDFQNKVLHTSSHSGFGYLVQVKPGRTPEQSPGYHHPYSILPQLVELGLVKESPPSTSSGRSESFWFTREAKEAFRARNQVSDTSIQTQLGLHLYGRLKALRRQYTAEQQDLEALADRWGISVDRVIHNALALMFMGYVEPGHSGEQPIEQGFIYLTRPKGITWANAGAPPIAADGSPTVNVAVHVTLQQYIQQVEALPISEDDKAKFEPLLRRIEEEGKKEEPSYKPVQDALDMFSKVKELAPIGIRFFSDHLDTIQRMAGHIPGV